MKHFLHKTVAVLLIVSILSTVSVLAASGSYADMEDSTVSVRFPDLVGHWARENVEALADKGIISGMDDGLFHPDEYVTLAQFMVMIINAAGGPAPPTDERWYSGYLYEALSRNVIDTDDVYHLWNAPLLRRDAARIGIRALGIIIGERDEISIEPAYVLHDLFVCRSCVWGIGQFYVKGIMVGRPDGFFDVNAEITRAEAAVVVSRIINPDLRTPQVATQGSGPVPTDGSIQPVDDCIGPC